MVGQRWPQDGARPGAARRLRATRDSTTSPTVWCTPAQTNEDTRLLSEISKVTLSELEFGRRLFQPGNFTVEELDHTLAPGELPAEVLRVDYWSDVKSKQPDGVAA